MDVHRLPPPSLLRSKNIMEPLPLIPKSKEPTNHDTSHIIREAFQEVLGEEILPQELAENMEKYNMKMEPLKICGVDANNIYDTCETILENIDEVEHEFLKRKAEYLIAKDLIDQHEAVQEIIKLKRQTIFRKMNHSNVDKYGLLEYNLLLPSVPERAMDFRLNSDPNMWHLPCKLDGGLPTISKPLLRQKNLIKRRDDSRINANKYCPPYKIQQNLSPRKLLAKRKDKIICAFRACPDFLIFYNYKLNVQYKKKLKLRNITNTFQQVSVKSLCNTKYFGIHLESPSKVAGGMNVVYTVSYKTAIYDDIRDTIIFRTSSGQEVTVRLASQRDSPILRAYIFRYNQVLTKPEKLISTSSFYDVDRTVALNSTIDCGVSFLGQEVILHAIMKNEGGYGKFFIITEEDWFSLNVESLNTNMELHAGGFHIFPAYFEMAPDEFVNINVTFYPTMYGLFVQTVYILCTNNTYIELDLIGDGINYESSLVTIDLKKKEGRPFYLDYESDYCLHVGRCLGCTKLSANIRVYNNSSLDLSYRWNVRKCENINSDCSFKQILPHWITIVNLGRCLSSYSSYDFELCVFPEIREKGLYRIVLSLYIENIPEASLVKRQMFTVVERADYADSKLLDILVAEIEVMCEVEEVSILVEPNPLNIPFTLSCNSSYKQSFSVVNCTNYHLQCKWLPHKDNSSVVINPSEFTLEDTNFPCMVSVSPSNFEDIEEEFILDVNDGIFKDIFLVTAKVTSPSAWFSTSTLDFGTIVRGLFYRQSFHIKSDSPQPLSWYMIEDVQDIATGNIATVHSPSNVNPYNGTLRVMREFAIEYVASTEKCGEWISYLKLFTNFSKLNVPDSVCAVHFMVSKPKIMLHTNTSEMPILCPHEILYASVPTNHHICVHNGGSVDTIFAFGKPAGRAADDFEIVLVPRFGNIYVGENIHVDVKVTPSRMGYYEDILIPCFILGIDRAFAIRLMCVVGDVVVNVYVPNELGNYNMIVWPEMKMCESCYCEDGVEEHTPSVKSTEVQTAFDDIKTFLEEQVAKEHDKKIMFTDENSGLLTHKHSGTSSPDQYCLTTIYHYVDKNVTRTNSSQSGKSLASSKSQMDVRISSSGTPSSSITVSTSTSTSSTEGSECGILTKADLKKIFGPESTSHSCFLLFSNVPLKTPVKKVIKIENLTPGYGTIYSEVVNFYYTEPEEDIVRDAMVNMNLIKSNEWEDIVTSEGIVVKIQPPGKNLNPFETVELEIWVYANTWGSYIEELIIDISELSPFCATLAINVVGLAIEFPIALNTICNEPTLRLGIMPYKSENIYRRIKIINTSMVPVYISWHFYMRDDTCRHFSILFDIVDPNTEGELNMLRQATLTKERFGVPTITYFKAHPDVSVIRPRNYAYLDLTIEVSNFHEEYYHKKIEALLVGSIHLTKDNMFRPNLFYRQTGPRICMAKLKVTGKLNIPHIVIDDPPDEIEMIVYASNVIEESTFVKTKRLMFKNERLSEAYIHMDVQEPFEFISVNTLHSHEKNFSNCVNLKPQEGLEVVIKCEINSEDVIKFSHRTRFDENTRILTRLLSIYERNVLDMQIPFHLVIFYPAFKVLPKEIMFSNVFIGNTAKTIVTLKNLTAAPIPFQIVKSNKTHELLVVPQSGVMPQESTGEDVVVSVLFTPREPITYKEFIIISSNIPRYDKSITIIGMGSYNETFYVPGKH